MIHLFTPLRSYRGVIQYHKKSLSLTNHFIQIGQVYDESTGY